MLMIKIIGRFGGRKFLKVIKYRNRKIGKFLFFKIRVERICIRGNKF